MADPFFFIPEVAPTLAEILVWTGATAPENADLSRIIEAVGPLDRASNCSLAFFENVKYLEDLGQTRALACLVHPKYADKVPATTIALVSREPYRAFAQVLGKLYPSALRPTSSFGVRGVSPGVSVHPTARLEKDVTVDPGAVIGPGAEIGSGTFIGANSVIGAGVRIGRECSIGPHVSVLNALIGNRVILLSGARIGQDGFGFAMGPQGHLKVPQIGRVILQDDVEIGANTTIDRGANRDTIIGEGTKIDNLVQIGHNVVVGRHCVITGQVGIAGSTQLDDFVVIGGQAGLAGHLNIGMGAQIAASSGVMTDIPAGARFGGNPAQPFKDFFKELAFIRKFVADSNKPTQKPPEGAM